MPLDAGILDSRIPLAAGASVPKIHTPAENMAIVADAENARTIADSNRLKLDEQQQAMADQQAMQRVMQEAGGDWEVALPRLRALAPGAASKLETQLATTRKERALALKGEAELEKLGIEHALGMLRTVTPENYAALRPRLAAINEDLGTMLPEQYDPEALARIQQFAIPAIDAAKMNAQAAELYASGKPQEAMSRALLAAQDQEDVDHALAAGQEMGLTRAQIALFPRDFAAPNFRARVEQFAMSADQRADNAARDTKQAADIAHQQVIEAQGERRTRAAEVRAARTGQGGGGEPVVAVLGPDGKAVYVPRSQAAGKAPAGSGEGGGSGLPPRVETTVRNLSTAFRNEAAVKRAVTMGEAVSFVNSLNTNTKNPADDQALIYAFAKAMDPESVVREGEYATVAKYSQSWLQQFGFDAMRVIGSNVPILTAQARENLKKTITGRFNASRGTYDNLVRSYVGQINKATGLADGQERLTDYGAIFPGAAPQPVETTQNRGGSGMAATPGDFSAYLNRRKGGR